jgi:hypothetical protein
VFTEAGFVISKEKSDVPGDMSQRKLFLGLEIDTRDMSLYVPEDKLEHIVRRMKEFFRLGRFQSAREVAKITGRLSAIAPACGPPLVIMIRRALIDIDEATGGGEKSWNKKFELSECAWDCLKQAMRGLAGWNGHFIQSENTQISLVSHLAGETASSSVKKIPCREMRQKVFTICLDASDTHVASYSLDKGEEFVCIKDLTADQQAESSSHRELWAVHHTLEKFGAALRQEKPATVFWVTDNRNLANFLVKGSGLMEILERTLVILEKAKELRLEIVPVWVRRTDERLQKADALTKGKNSDDWSLSSRDFAQVEQEFGKFEFDLFATTSNSKCQRFYSFRTEIASSGVNALAQVWAGPGRRMWRRPSFC